MAPPSTPKNPVRRPPGRSQTLEPSQSSVAPQSVPYQACPPPAFQLPDAPRRPTEPQIVQQPHLTTDFQFFATGGPPFGDYYSLGTAFNYTGDFESAGLDLAQPFPALGLPSTVHSAINTTPIDPQLSSGGHQVSTSTQITPAKPEANLTTNPAISSISQVPAQEQSQPTVEERVLALPSTTAQNPSQAAPPAESISVPGGLSEQHPPATGKRVQNAQPKKSPKRNVDQVDDASQGQPEEQPKEQQKKARKRNVDQVGGQSAPGPSAKKKATGKPEEQPEEQSGEQTLTALSNPQVPQALGKLKQTRQSRRSRWTQAFTDTLQHNQAVAEALIDNFKPIEPQPANLVVDLTGEGPAEKQPDGDQPAGDQSTGEQSTGEQSTGEQSTGEQSTMNLPVMDQPTGEQSPIMSAGNQPPNIPAQIQDPAIRPPGYYADKDVRRKIKIGGVTLSRAGLGLPHFLTRDEIHRRISFIDEEIQNQKGKAPILPPSELAQPGPKPFTPKAYNVPASIKDPRVRHFFDKKNHDLCTKNKQIDLDRNNQAAKGTRSRREEALDKHRELANEMAIELNWWRIKAISLGADFREWDQVPETVKGNMTKEMTERVEKLEAAAAKEAKKQRSAIHSARTKENARLSKEDEARKKQEILEVAAAYAAGDHALIEKMADPNYQAALPESSPAAAGRNITANGQISSRKKRASVIDQNTETNTAANVTTAIATEGVAETTNNTGLTNDIVPDTMASDTMDFGDMDFGSMEFDNMPPTDQASSYDMPSGYISPYAMPPGNTLGFDNGAQVNTSIAPAQFNMTSAPMYGGASVDIPTYPNIQNNAFGNAQTQHQQSSDLPQGTNNGQELRRQSSNVTMFDAEPETMQPLDPNMGTMMDETSPYWEVTNAPSSSTLTSNMDSFQGPMGDVSTLPPNTMSHSIHGPLGSPHLLPPNNIGQNSNNLANDVPWYSEPEALVNAFLPNLQKNQGQNESAANDKGSTDQVDDNANSSAYPDPVEESYMSRYLNLSP